MCIRPFDSKTSTTVLQHRRLRDKMAQTTVYTEEDVSIHNNESDCWLIIEENGENNVYDVTKYLSDHPGGPEIMLEFAGKNASEMFEDIGHSNEARKKMSQYLIGKLKNDGSEPKQVKKKQAAGVIKSSGGLNPLAIVVLLLAIALGIYYSMVVK